jgi:hypothetical protein
MFTHPKFQKYDFQDVPLDQDIFLMDEKWMVEYEQAWVEVFNGGNYENVGYISYAAARVVDASSIELSWYPNIFDRFHEVLVQLPRVEFVVCVDVYDYDEKPHLFVKSEWLRKLYLRGYSVFAIVDAVGVKQALRTGTLEREKLIKLRKRIDHIAKQYRDVSFVSFADSLLIKTNWYVGQYDSRVKYTYEPEIVIRLLADIRSAYRNILGMEVYAVLTQGSNEYYDDALLHISGTQNHISLNSLGLPFSQLRAIDDAAREAIRNGIHTPAELYMDSNFYHSLSFSYDFTKDKNARPKNVYKSPMSSGESFYFYSDYRTIRDNLSSRKPRRNTHRLRSRQS